MAAPAMHKSASRIAMTDQGFDAVFSDTELQAFLNKVADGEIEDVVGAELFAADSTAPAMATGLPLQFFPLDTQPQVTVDSSSFSSITDQLQNNTLASPGQGLDGQPALLAGLLKPSSLPGSVDLPGTGNCNLGGPSSVSPPPLLMPGLGLPQHMMGGFYAPSLPAPQPARPYRMPTEKPQVSHSTVEKQRRDRINALIDELRDLVPPQKSTPGAAQAGNVSPNLKDAASAEARRPKHVVLADTIAYLKHIHAQAKQGSLALMMAAAAAKGQQPPALLATAVPTGAGARGASGPDQGAAPKVSLSGMAGPSSCQAPVGVKEEPQSHAQAAAGGAAAAGVAQHPRTHHLRSSSQEPQSRSNSNSKGSMDSHDDVDMKECSHRPELPHIPIKPTQLSGVVVDRGPDCMYVQVKCRDRKGLLSDIINALKNLPLEVRTASVTTQDGLVRDVFEVKLDDDSLQPEEVQNMVHEALFQQYGTSGGETGKRSRS